MLAELTFQEIGGGINLVDVGASGKLAAHWKAIENLINLFAFEPNREECEKLRQLSNGFHSATFLPFAISNHDGEAVLYKTKSIYCWSLLEPRLDWFRRFSFGGAFEPSGRQKVQTSSLDGLDELRGIDVDVIKTASQGLDMEVLARSGPLLDKAFCVEAKPGFVQHYVGENTYSEVDAFLRSKGFLLFDIRVFRISRHNQFASCPTGKEEIMWCEATWLKDYVALETQGELRGLCREKALKALILCGLLNCIDFGYELALFFNHKGLVFDEELAILQERNSWSLNDAKQSAESLKNADCNLKDRIFSYGFRLLPSSWRRIIADQAYQASLQPHLLKSILRSNRRGACSR